MDSIIKLKNVSKSYGTKKVLSNVKIDILSGEYISIIGRSGAGKSTLMNIIGGLDSDYLGDYFFQGQLIYTRQKNRLRNQHIGFIFQQYNLLPLLSAKENVLLPYSFCSDNIDGIHKRCDELFEKFGLTEQKHQLVNTMSGGEKQRIALLRSIIMEPEIIIADEPTGNLDCENALIIRDFLLEMHRKGKTIIVVTHDLQFANEAQRHFKIESGELYEE